MILVHNGIDLIADTSIVRKIAESLSVSHVAVVWSMWLLCGLSVQIRAPGPFLIFVTGPKSGPKATMGSISFRGPSVEKRAAYPLSCIC